MLKKLLFTIVLTCFLSNFLSAQNGFFVFEEMVDSVIINADISQNNEYFGMRTFIGNDSEETVEVSWRHQIADNCPNQWRLIASDPQLDYNLQEIPESVIPTVLEPEAMDDFFLLNFFPEMVSGCCDVAIEFFSDDEPDVTVASINFHIEINEPECSPTNTHELATTKFKIFPNPIDNTLFIDSEQNLAGVRLMNVHGQLIKEFSSKAKSYPMSEIAGGIYFVTVVTDSGIYFTQRIIKQ